MTRVRTRSALALVALLGALAGVAVPSAAFAAPASGGGRVLDVTGTIGAVAGGSQGTLQIEIPEGFRPVKLTGTVTPQNPGKGDAVYSVDEVRAGAVPTDHSRTISTALSASEVHGGMLEIGLRYVVPNTTTALCPSTDVDLITLANIKIHLVGTAQPLTSVADFFSDTVNAVSVIIPDDPTQEEREAGLIAVDAVAVRYQLPVVVTLTTESDTEHRPRLDTVFGRVVRIQTANAYITTKLISSGSKAPALLISGRSDELSAAASGLASQFLQIADSQVAEGPIATLDPSSSLSFTLDELGHSDIEMQGYGRSETSIGIRQSQFSGPVDSIAVHLTGTHSAINDSIAASIQLYWNSQLVASTMLTQGADTSFDASFTLSSAYLNASNTLTIQLNSVPQGGNCQSTSSAIIPLDLSVNGKASTITATRGQGLPAGFQRFPQTLANHLPIAFSGQGDPADLVAAAGCIVVALQRVNVQQFVVTVPSLSEFKASGDSGVIVGATPDDARNFEAPLRFSEFKAVDQSDAQFAVGVDAPFAAAEAFEQNGRDVLLLGGYSPDSSTDATTSALESTIAGQVENDQFGWDGLYNDLLILTSEADKAVIFKSAGLAPNPEVIADYSTQGWWILIALGIVIVVVIVVAVSLARRRRRVRRLVDEQERADAERGDAVSARADDRDRS